MIMPEIFFFFFKCVYQSMCDFVQMYLYWGVEHRMIELFENIG